MNKIILTYGRRFGKKTFNAIMSQIYDYKNYTLDDDMPNVYDYIAGRIESCTLPAILKYALKRELDNA